MSVRVFYSILLIILLFPQLVFGQAAGPRFLQTLPDATASQTLPSQNDVRVARLIDRSSPGVVLFSGPGILEFNDGTKSEGTLAYHAGERPYLNVTTSEGRRMYSPYQIRSFTLNNHHFITADGFDIVANGDFGGRLTLSTKKHMLIRRDFVEVLESGDLELLVHYAFFVEQYTSNGPYNYVQTKYNVPFRKFSYLLRQRGQRTPFAVIGTNKEDNGSLRDALLPHFSGRPDLLQKLEQNLITYENLPPTPDFPHAGLRTVAFQSSTWAPVPTLVGPPYVGEHQVENDRLPTGSEEI